MQEPTELPPPEASDRVIRPPGMPRLLEDKPWAQPPDHTQYTRQATPGPRGNTHATRTTHTPSSHRGIAMCSHTCPSAHHSPVLTHASRHGQWLEEPDLGSSGPSEALAPGAPPTTSPTAGAAVSSSLLPPMSPGLRAGGKQGGGQGRPGRTEERVCGHTWRWSTACLLL